MRISDILKTNKVTVSCEMFPPKPGKPLENTQQVVHEIAAYKPSFMSVTYGAGGSNSKNTLSIAEEVQKSGVTAPGTFDVCGAGRREPQSVHQCV